MRRLSLGLAVVALLLLRTSSTRAQGPATSTPVPKIGGYIQVRETWQEPTGLSATLNRARVSVVKLPNVSRSTCRFRAST